MRVIGGYIETKILDEILKCHYCRVTIAGVVFTLMLKDFKPNYSYGRVGGG